MKKMLAVFLILALLCSAVAVPSTAAETASFSETSVLDGTGQITPVSDVMEDGPVTELVALRSEDTKHFDLGNGLYKAVKYSEAVHRRAADGTFKDIDNSLSLQSFGNVERYALNDGRISFAPAHASDTPLLVLTEDGYTLSMSYVSEATVSGQTNAEVHASPVKPVHIENHSKRPLQTTYASLAEAVMIDTKTTVLYENIESNAHLEYILKGNNIKENIVVTEKADAYCYSFLLKVTGLSAVLTENGAILFLDIENNAVRYIIPVPYMQDANGKLSHAVSYQMEEVSEGIYLIVVEADANWINADDRALPVKIDPSITNNYLTPMDTYIRQGDTTPNGAEEEIEIEESTVAFIKADLPALPDGAVISEAMMCLTGEAFFAEEGYEGEAIVDVHEVTSPWNEATLAWGTSYSYSATPFASVSFDIYDGSSADVTVDVTNLAIAWQQNPESNYGIALQYVSGECEAFYIVAKEYGGSYAVMEVLYAHEIPEGIYALRQTDYTGVDSYLWFYEDMNTYVSVPVGGSPLDTFDKKALFIISKVSGTASGFPTYVIRPMVDNYTTLDIQSDGTAIPKQISGSNASVAAADTFSITWSYQGGFMVTQKGSHRQLDPAKQFDHSNNLWSFERFIPSQQNIEMIIDGMQRNGKTVTLTPEEITAFDRDMTVHTAYTNNASLVWDVGAEKATVTWNAEGFLRLQYRYKLSADGAYKAIGYSYTILPNEYFIRNKESKLANDDNLLVSQHSKTNQTFLQAADSMPSPNDTVAAMPFDGERYQKWVLSRVGTTDYYKIRYSDGNENSADDLFLTYVPANGSSGNAMVMLKLADSTIGSYQTWKMTRSEKGNWIIRPQATEAINQCLYFNSGTNVTISIYNNDADDRDEWVLAEIGYASEVELEAQQTDVWCWAAAARMFAKHYHSDLDKTQKEAAEAIKGDAAYIAGGDFAEQEQAIAYYTQGAVIDTFSPVQPKIYSLEILRRYLDSGNVLIASIRGYDVFVDEVTEEASVGLVSRHAFLIYGYVVIDNGVWLLIKDPSPIMEGCTYMVSYHMFCMGEQYGDDRDPVYAHSEDELLTRQAWFGVVARQTSYGSNEEEMLQNRVFEMVTLLEQRIAEGY